MCMNVEKILYLTAPLCFFSAHSFPLSLISIKCYYYVHFPVSYYLPYTCVLILL